jgi:hypothetical protein
MHAAKRAGISRRQFLGRAVAGAGAYGVIASPALAALRTTAADITTQVAVLGGGVGGLTAAHELAERGFQVTVFEPKALGGKARSIPVPGTGTDGRRDLPGEHGFRFFPGFYKNVPDTMRRIPVAGNANGVMDHLVDATQEMIIFHEGPAYLLPKFNEWGFAEGIRSTVTTIGIAGSVPPNEIEYFLRKIFVFQASSDARRLGQWEKTPWWDFVNAEHFSPAYQRTFGNGLTKDLVAAKGTKASTRTIGLMALAFVYAIMAQSVPPVREASGYGAADRLLDLPTNEAWIDPWVAHLRSLGVKFVTGGASKLSMDGGEIAGVTIRDGATSLEVKADYYVAAMPVEKARVLFDDPVRAADPQLARLDRLEYDYMNGIQFFLNRKQTNPVQGHVAFLNSPWALTSISQGVFWRNDLSATYGDGRLKDILSVDISDFFTPGILYGKAAVDCTADEIAKECWAQVKQGFNEYADTQTAISDDMLISWFLDPAIVFSSGQPAVSTEPLLINTAGCWADRPESATAIPNLFLASDYVRCNIDLATMEGANEAGRQAANAILDRSGSSASKASLGTLWESPTWDSAKQLDEQLYNAGQPNELDLLPSAIPA